MTSLKIPIAKGTLMVTEIERYEGAIAFDVEVSAHILRNIGGTSLSVYIHDKRGLDSNS